MGKAKSSKKTTKKPITASGMVSKSTNPTGGFNKASGMVANQHFSSSKKKGGFNVTPRKAS